MKIMYSFGKATFVAVMIWLGGTLAVPAQLITLEPDNYADGTVLNTVIPGLSLVTARTDNSPIPFDVTATVDTFPLQPPTGDKVFAHVGIPFFNDIRKLRMDFDGVVSSISIDFMSGTPQSIERGQLEVYSSGGQLLDVYTTQPLLGGQIETMAIQHNQADIAWAVAYTLPGQTVFGVFDHLVFSQPVPVPEPGTIAILLAAGTVLLIRTARRSL